MKSSNAQLQNYMEKAFHDARRDWDSGLQVRWPTAGGGAASLNHQTTLNEAMTRDSIVGAGREGRR